MNYKTFPCGSYHSEPLPNYVLKQSADFTYALVPYNNDAFANVKASDYSLRSQLKSGVNLEEVNKIQPLNRASATDMAVQIMSNIKTN